jgi:hydrogenase maturation protease
VPETCRLRVVAVGSPHGADRIAWEVAAMLDAQALPQGTEVRCCVHPPSELGPLLQGADSVFLIDAMIDVAPGEMRRCGPAALQRRRAALSSHGLSVDLALDLAEALGELPRSLAIFGLGVGGSSAPADDHQIAAALPHYAAALAAAIRLELEAADQRPEVHT